MEIIVYTTKTCPYCTTAKNWLKENGYEYKEATLEDPLIRKEFFEKYPGVRTVPQIVVDNERIGGYTDLIKSKLNKNNQV